MAHIWERGKSEEDLVRDLSQTEGVQSERHSSHQHSAAAAAAKSLQSCPTLCDPIDGSPPGSSIHGIFQARVLEWGAIAFSASTF